MASVTYNIRGKYDPAAAEQAKQGLAGVSQKVNGITKDIKTKFSGLTSVNKSFSSLFKSLPKLTALSVAVGVVSRAMKKLKDSASECEQAWAETETSFSRVDFAGKINKALGSTSTDIKSWAQNLSDDINGYFDDGAILSSMESILYDLPADKIKEITKAAVDLSAATGDDLTQSVKKLAETFKGSAGDLEKMFPSLKKLTAAELESGKGVELIAKKVKGAAAEMSNTTAGSLKRAQDASEALKSELGAVFTGAMTPMRNFFSELKQGWADSLRKKREYKQEKADVENGTANSTEYNNQLTQLYQRQAELQAQLALRTPQNRQTVVSNSRGYVTAQGYDSATANLEKALSEVNRQIDTTRIKADAAAGAEQDAADAQRAAALKDEQASEAKKLALQAQIQEINNKVASGEITQPAAEKQLRELTNTDWQSAVKTRDDANSGPDLKAAAQQLINSIAKGWKISDAKPVEDAVLSALTPAQKALRDFNTENGPLMSDLIQKTSTGNTLTEDETDALANLTQAQDKLRSAVEEEGYNREQERKEKLKASVSNPLGGMNGTTKSGTAVTESFSNINTSFSNLADALKNGVDVWDNTTQSVQNVSAAGVIMSSVLQGSLSSLDDFGAVIQNLMSNNPIGIIIQAVVSLVSEFKNVASFAQSISFSTIFSGWGSSLRTEINAVAVPLVNVLKSLGGFLQPIVKGLLTIMANVLNNISVITSYVLKFLTPVIKVLMKIITILAGNFDMLGDVFTLLWNNVFRYIMMGILAIIETIGNVFVAVWNGIADVINALDVMDWFTDLKRANYFDYSDLDTGTIDSSSSSDTGTSDSSSSSSTGASYTAAKDVYVNIYYEHSYVNGDVRAIALNLRDELKAAEALGL